MLSECYGTSCQRHCTLARCLILDMPALLLYRIRSSPIRWDLAIRRKHFLFALFDAFCALWTDQPLHHTMRVTMRHVTMLPGFTVHNLLANRGPTGIRRYAHEHRPSGFTHVASLLSNVLDALRSCSAYSRCNCYFV